jgi:hypothetical protein
LYTQNVKCLTKPRRATVKNPQPVPAGWNLNVPIITNSAINRILVQIDAYRLGLIAQRLRDQPIAEVHGSMLQMRRLGKPVDERLLRQTVQRTVAHLGRLGRLDTCLVSALVFAAMTDRTGLTLMLGFLQNTPTRQPDGHAWLTQDGVPVFGSDDNADNLAAYIVSRQIPL